MRSGRCSSMQGTRPADGTRLVVDDRSLRLVGLQPELGCSNSDGSLGSAAGGRLALVGAPQDARGSAAGRLPRVDDDQVGSAGESDTSHGSHSEYAPSSSGSHCSLSELSDSRWGVSDWSEHESSGSSASGSSHSENHSPRRVEESEVVEQQDAEWLMDNEAQHAAGTCKPCLYLRTEAGCAAGRACRYCHLPHAAPSTAGRIPCKQLVRRSDSKCGGDADAVRDLADDCHLAQRHMLGAFRERDPQQGPVGAEPGGPTQAAACEKPEQFPSCG
ncbi:unnamed protein product [Prorocentrum cordatum]|uniref:C3H1-type domain-containing protein n=1 Tax=Prorocentrum cordatum TaxID=2364126 RepID=A0ABN9TRZ6_9DINO|nr:unnamed protein product [Polarella glacialis]